jgi:ABC-type cobalamin/Fe3+-siderophores transport system ATPase subunit
VSEVLRLDAAWVAFDRGLERISVLEDVSLSVSAGEIVAVVAGAGRGKTTLIRLASGTLPADRGSVYVNGTDVSRLSDRQFSRVLASDVGVATGAGPGARVSVREYVEIAAAAPKRRWRRRWRRRERRQMATAVLNELGLGARGPLRWGDLSDWERVLVELAQAVVVRPRLLLIDNVADAFGLAQKQALMDVLERFARDYDAGVLMAVSDHAAALRAVRVWQLQRRSLRLMADHTAEHGGADANVIALPRRQSDAC